MKNFWKDPETQKLSKKRIILTVLVALIIIALITVISLYANNRNVRDWIDINIFKKEKTQNNLPSIELEDESNVNICAFSKYIGILDKNNFKIYGNSGSKEKELTLEISKPLFSKNGRYLVVAEDGGKKLYLIADKDIVWERDIEGEIQQVTVNKNGYVAVTIVNTSVKTVIQLFDSQGNSLFKTILATTRSVASSISEDNKYLAIARVDTTGTMVQSSIQIMTINDAKNNNGDSTKKEYNGDKDELITNIKYQDKNKLVCMYNDKIKVIKADGTEDVLQDFNNKKISFSTIELSNSTMTIEEKSSGIFTADSIVNIMNSDNKNVSTYTANSVTKEIYTNGSVIALNLGSEVDFINTSGWLIKRYTADQEISKMVLSESIAGIIYRDKIEIIEL